MKTRAAVAAAALVVLAGCFPIELDVSGGRILVPREEGFFAYEPATGAAVRVYAPTSGQPVFGRFSPDGKSLLAVTQQSGEMMGLSHTVAVVTPADGSARTVFGGANCTYARWSPDGARIAVSRIADSAVEPLEENLPELHVADAAGGKARKLASNVSALHRWFPDAKAVLVFRTEAKDGQRYRGALSAIGAADGKETRLAAVIGSRDTFFDLSPDGKTALFTAFAASGPDGKPEAGEDAEEQLFALAVGTGAVRAVKKGVSFAIWSPKGTKVLLGVADEDGGGGMGGSRGLKLQVADAALAKFQTAAKGAAASAGGIGADAKIYPGWLDEETIYYVGTRSVFGAAGQNLELVTVGADGKSRKSHQTAVDQAAGRR